MKTTAQFLTKGQIDSFELLLKEQRADILRNTKTLRVNFTVNKDDLMDEVDIALADIEQGMKMRLGNREGLYFKKIEEALLRIKEGSYGNCLECGNPIGNKRLEARPTAELCIDCKEASEKAEALNAEGRKHKSLGEMINFKA